MMTYTETRPKPWETNGGTTAAVDRAFDIENEANNSLMSTRDTTTQESHEQGTREGSEPPEVVPRPPGLTNTMNGGVGTGMYNSGGYGYDSGIYGGGMYGNNGGMFGSMYSGAMNRYGGMYGGGYGNYGSFYNNGYNYGGAYGDMGGNGLEQIGESTRATFQLIESLIGAVTGFAQMLESTYMATHNSFFTMISVAEQFNYLKEVLGSAFGIFAIMKFLKRLLYFVTNGRLGSAPKRIQGGGNSGNSRLLEEFSRFGLNNDKAPARKITLKPLLFFLSAVFGFPYLLNKFIQKLQEVQQRNSIAMGKDGDGTIDPSKLEFARALYDFTPENPQIEITLKKGDLVAIISKADPLGRSSDWWKVRNRAGQNGYAPYNYLEIIKRVKKQESKTPPA